MSEKEFEKVVKEYGKQLYGYLLKILVNPDNADDVMQSTFSAFYKNMSHIDPEKYISYLFRTAHNKAINYSKKEKRYTVLHDYAPELTVEESEVNYEYIKIALKELKPQELFVVELKYYQNKNYAEIAEIMDITVSAVDSILVRAKRKLRKLLQDK